jgi:hypothetical protein
MINTIYGICNKRGEIILRAEKKLRDLIKILRDAGEGRIVTSVMTRRFCSATIGEFLEAKHTFRQVPRLKMYSA